MRSAFSYIFLFMILALGVCAAVSARSRKAMGHSVALLLTALIPPVTGNLILVASSDLLLSTVGCYAYFLGMDLVMFALLRFAFRYCRVTWSSKPLMGLVYLLLIIDALQYIANPFLHQAFGMERLMLDGRPYFRMVPYLGQAFHRVVDYGIFLAAIFIFIQKTISTPRVYAERYWVILFAMIVGGLWQTYSIFSRAPIDRSMIGFGVFGLLVFYFSIYYRPVRLLDQMLASIASGMPEALFLFDAGGRCVWANQPGIALANIRDNNFESANERLTRLFGKLETDGEWSARRAVNDGAAMKYYALSRHIVADDKARVVGAFLSLRDDTEQQLALRREMYNANHDSLTGLYTREHLFRRIQEELRAHPQTAYLASYLDVNDFKMVNDVFGNAFGDQVLRYIADTLRRDMPKDALYGRLAGDTFGLFMPVSSFDEGKAEKILTQFNVPTDTVDYHLIIHQGVYEITERDMDVAMMFDRAHMALSTIKGEFKRHIAYYDDAMRDSALWDQRITAQLGAALEQRQIRPYLQAMVDCDGRIVGAEALVRWQHPTEGLLSPARFVPTFEQNGMIADVDRYMWRCACEVLADWRRRGREDLFISINISPKDFYFMDVTAELKGIVREFDVKPSQLRVEITETVMMTDNENRIRILNELKEAGFIVEMDDFGSGYSSLNMLKDMPVDVIKIDMMFLKQTENDEKAQTILHNIMNLTNDLNISSLTEGVETEAQYRMLSRMGCKLFQGYFFAKPAPVEAFEDMVFK